MHVDHLQPGEEIPAESERAISIKMLLNTVRQVHSKPEKNDLIRHIRGRGTLTRANATQRSRLGSDAYRLAIPDARCGYNPSLQAGSSEEIASSHNQEIVSDAVDNRLRQADRLLPLIDKKVEGIAIVPTTNPANPTHQSRPISEPRIPVDFCSRNVERTQAQFLAFSGLDAGRMTAEAKADWGRRRIAMFNARRAEWSGQHERGLREAMQASGGNLPESFVRSGNFLKPTAKNEQPLATKLKELLNSRNRPTAISCTFDSIEEMAHERRDHPGVNAPHKGSLIGFREPWQKGHITRRFISVAKDEEELDRRADRLLEDLAVVGPLSTNPEPDARIAPANGLLYLLS